MNVQKSIGARIRRLKRGKHFTVATEADRQVASKIGRTLRDSKVISVRIITRKEGDVFIVAAI